MSNSSQPAQVGANDATEPVMEAVAVRAPQTVWRIVSVRGLPVHVAPGEAA